MTDDDNDRRTTTTRLPSLTGMRFFAAFLVFVCHALVTGYFHAGTQARFGDFAFAAGWLGVEFFFVLSGFVLAWAVREGQSRTAFWRRRLVKVYPNHVLTWLAALGLAAWAGRSLDLVDLLPSLFLVHTWLPRAEFILTVNVVTWSLACDLFFYLAFPFLWAGIRRIPERFLWASAGGVVAVIVALPAVALALVPGEPRIPGQEMSLTQNWFLVSFPPVRALDFVLGILMARIVTARRWIGLPPSAALGLLLVGFAAQIALWPTVYGLTATVVAPIALLIASIAVADVRGDRSLLRTRPLQWLGEISFASYLVHFLVLVFVHEALGATRSWDAPVALALVTALWVLTTALAWGLYRFAETPAMRLWAGPSTLRPRPRTPVSGGGAPVPEPS
ncbi:acyltransferase [Actinocorallia sp. API 0066]|uniref:acyltransferase family protein n=1 Tax=Actinocorallia sp. API 0066 TaxID=2896846 RepID=UPI001E5878EA|nr:acyltransferase [Actinocorallia sp. API 0066]MCD0451606.1 acyltransferase [Actinocorallia sp. API 0066]